MPDEASLRTWESVAIAAARAAADLIRTRAVDSEIDVKSSPTDVVTQTDLDSERLITQRLLAATPDAGVIGEEDGQHNARADLQWIIDPLDGTVNFTYGVPIVGVSVAASHHGAIVVGCVVDVVHGDVYSAALGCGARRNGQPIRPSACDELSMALLVTGYSYRPEIRLRHGAIIASMLGDVRDVRCFGSAALHLCWLASGNVDAYYERDIKLWDYAAGALIAHEAGVVVERPCPENDGAIIAATPRIFETLRRLAEERSATVDRLTTTR